MGLTQTVLHVVSCMPLSERPAPVGLAQEDGAAALGSCKMQRKRSVLVFKAAQTISKR